MYRGKERQKFCTAFFRNKKARNWLAHCFKSISKYIRCVVTKPSQASHKFESRFHLQAVISQFSHFMCVLVETRPFYLMCKSVDVHVTNWGWKKVFIWITKSYLRATFAGRMHFQQLSNGYYELHRSSLFHPYDDNYSANDCVLTFHLSSCPSTSLSNATNVCFQIHREYLFKSYILSY